MVLPVQHSNNSWNCNFASCSQQNTCRHLPQTTNTDRFCQSLR